MWTQSVSALCIHKIEGKIPRFISLIDSGDLGRKYPRVRLTYYFLLRFICLSSPPFHSCVLSHFILPSFPHFPVSFAHFIFHLQASPWVTSTTSWRTFCLIKPEDFVASKLPNSSNSSSTIPQRIPIITLCPTKSDPEASIGEEERPPMSNNRCS